MFEVKVGTRKRITVPYDCWTKVANKMKTLKLWFSDGVFSEWHPGVGMTKDMSFRVTVPFKEGTILKLIPIKTYIKVVEV